MRARRAVRTAGAALAFLMASAVLPVVTPAGAAPLPSVTVGDVTAVEGDSGIAGLKVPIDLSVPSAARIKVPFTVKASADGATSAADVQLRVGTVTFGPGQTSKVIVVNSIGDTVVEPDQHVLVTLGTPLGGATIADGIGIVKLVDDDANGVSPRIEVSVGDTVLSEADAGVHKGYIPVTLSRPATVVTKVAFALDCTTTAFLNDLTIKKKGTVTFRPGERSKQITFKISANAKPEQVAEVVQHITSKVATVKVLDSRGDATVNDDDGGAQPTFTGKPVPGFTTEALPSGSTFGGPPVGTIEQLTLTPSGGQPTNVWPDQQGGGWISRPGPMAISHDGRFVSFASDKADLVAGDTNGLPDVFVRDRATGTTERVSLRADGTQMRSSDVPNGSTGVSDVRISADGRYVAFQTWASLVPSDPLVGLPANGWPDHQDVYVFDRVARTTRPVSVATNGQFIHGRNPEISANGRYVMFESHRGSSGSLTRDIYVRDMHAGTTTRVFEHGNGNGTMSANGRFVVALSEGRLCYDQQLVVLDLVDGSTERVDVTDDGEGADYEDAAASYMYTPTISADGRYVAFKTHAWNMIPGMGYPGTSIYAFDMNLVHVYVRDRVDRSTTLVGSGPNGQVPPPTWFSTDLSLSGDGRKLAIANHTGDALAGPGTVWDLAAGTSMPLGFPHGPMHLSTWISPGAFSGDGRFVAFANEFRVNASTFLGNAYAQRVP